MSGSFDVIGRECMAGTLAAFNCRRRGRVSRPCANESPKATADIIGDSIICKFCEVFCLIHLLGAGLAQTS